MADNETVVAQVPAMEYPSKGYPSTDTAVDSTSLPDISTLSSGATGDLSTSAVLTNETYAVPNGSNLVDGNAYNMNPDSVMQEAFVASTYEAKPADEGANINDNHVSQENAGAESSVAVIYDSSANGKGIGEASFTLAGNGENENASNDAGEPAPLHQFGEGSAFSTEEDRLWSIVRANCLDFNAWTALIDETEKVAEDNILKLRKVYDSFLAEFPLCYGYWKKYADHEARLGSIEKVVEVYERAVEAVTYSVDIWLHYSVFAISTYGDPDTIRRLFERGLAYVGTDYLSYPLWDKYIEYEYSLQEWSHLAMIYTRILENPNQQLERYFNSFKELSGSRPLSELRTAEDAAAMIAANFESSSQGVEREVYSDGGEQSNKPVSAGLTEVEEVGKYVAIREEMYNKAKEFDSKIISFETAIRRPYFHVRPLIGAELENWHNYLDFIEGEGDFNKVVKLYERCLIACANYPDYWMRYVLCMEASGSMDLANNALARAAQVFVKRQPEIHLFAAKFKEQTGDIMGARAAYQLLHSEISPGLLEAIIKHANMERRLENMQDAFSLYEQAIATEKGKEQSQALPMLFVQYSRFLYLVAGNAEKAREILVEALDHVQLSKPVLEALIHLESIQSVPKQISYLDLLVDKFIVPNPDNPSAANTTDREDISSIFLEFLDLFGDAQSVKKADDRHSKLFLRHKSSSELKKRQAEDFLASDKAKLAKSYTDVPSPAQSVMGAYPSAQTQWAAGYGLQPQAWPQSTQVQGQQWNPSYAQQAGYGAYSSYGGSYTHPQMHASAPQTAAAYGTYPPAYPPVQQAPSQQNYAQPTTVTSLNPAQQQAAAPQACNGSYY